MVIIYQLALLFNDFDYYSGGSFHFGFLLSILNADLYSSGGVVFSSSFSSFCLILFI